MLGDIGRQILQAVGSEGSCLLAPHCEEAGKIRPETEKPAFPPVLLLSPDWRSASGPGLLPGRIRSG
ncbi:MAG: hypothetical protein ING72_12150 [Methylobacterium sp.]|nr:hypothetical protein [Methylobacterium sp.]